MPVTQAVKQEWRLRSSCLGDRNPSGHLSMTLPRSIGQLPLYYNAAPSGRPVNGYYTECRNYIDESGSPLYPFGYGLSYTSFQVEKARLEKETLSIAELSAGEKAVLHVWVSNTGERDGDTVLQREKRRSLFSGLVWRSLAIICRTAS